MLLTKSCTFPCRHDPFGTSTRAGLFIKQTKMNITYSYESKKRIRQEYHILTKRIIIQLFTKHKTMSNVGRYKSAKHDSLFMIYIILHNYETNICIAKIMRNNIRSGPSRFTCK